MSSGDYLIIDNNYDIQPAVEIATAIVAMIAAPIATIKIIATITAVALKPTMTIPSTTNRMMVDKGRLNSNGLPKNTTKQVKSQSNK